MISITQLSFVSAIVTAILAALFVLLGPRVGGARINTRDVFAALVFVVTVGVLETLALALLIDINRLGMAHILYVMVTVAIPVLGVTLIAIPLLPGYNSVLPNATPGALMLSLLMILPGVFGWFATRVEPNRIVVTTENVALAPARAGDASVRVGVVSDIQNFRVGDHEWNAVRRLNLERPDVILFAGDLFQGNNTQFEENLRDFQELMAGLSAPLGVYAVLGHTESRAEMEAMIEGTGVTLLDNSQTTIRVADRTITLAGTEADPRSVGAGETAAALERTGGNDIRILLSHSPDVIEQVSPGTRIDLIVSGHTHGTQIQLPVVGAIFDNVDVPRSVASGGLSTIDRKRIYVSPGVGVVRGQAPQVRFAVTPTVDLLLLQ